MSKLSASLFALAVVLSALVIPTGDAAAETLGTNTIYVPVVSDGSPVSTGVTVTLTNVHTGETIAAAYSPTSKLYVANSAPSGYYRVDVVAENHYDSIGEKEFRFTGLAPYVCPQVSLDSFDAKVWEWNVTVRNAVSNLKVIGAEVGFYDKAAREMVSMQTTNSNGVAVVSMFNAPTPGDYVLVVKADTYETYVEEVTVTADDIVTVLLTRSVRVWGYVYDSDGLPANNAVAYLLSNDSSQPWIKRLLKSEEGTMFTFDAYPGEFTLCVDADGVAAEFRDVDLTGHSPAESLDLTMTMADQTQRLDSLSMVYGSDFNSLTLAESTVWSYDDAFPGLDYNDIGSLRMQIDLNTADPDGEVDSTEAADFAAKVQGYGARFVTTASLMVVNDTHFYQAAVSTSTFSLGSVAGAVDSIDGVAYSYSCAYTAVDEIDVGAADYTADLYAAYDTSSVNYTYSVTLPTGYELVDDSSGTIGSHVVVSGYETFTVDPEEADGGPETVSLVIEASEGPSAGAGMEVEKGLVYEVTDEEGNTTAYIVRVGSEVNFTAADSDDPNDNPLEFTWSFDDGTPDVTTSNETVTHNYTSASASRTVNLTVTDAVGSVNWTEIEVLCDGRDPVPVLTVKDLEANETTGVLEVDQGETVWFNSTYSTDDVASAGDGLGVIDFFEFYYGDGNESDRISWTEDEKNVSHAFASSGTYDVVLNVTDVAGHWKNTTLTVKVNDSEAPVVSFVVKNATYGTNLIENATIVLDANATTDNLDDKDDMYFSWFFGDDQGDDSWLNGTGLWNVTHVFSGVEVFTVTLNVTDTSNNSASINRAVKIESGPRPYVVFDGNIYFEPAVFTEGETGYILVNLTNKGTVAATGVVVTFYIVDDDSQTQIGTWTKLLNGSTEVTQIEVGGKVQVRFPWTPDSRGVYKIKANVTSTNQLLVDTKTTLTGNSLEVKEAPWKKVALWGGIAAVIVLLPVLLYLRGRWSRRERRGPRREKREKHEKREKREKRDRKKAE